MSSVQPLYCPECRSEYLGSASVCADCGVALVGEESLGRHGVGAMPPASELICIRAASLGWASALSDRLAAEGISHRIEATGDDLEEGSVRRPGANMPYGVYVRADDVELAARLDEAFMRSQIPDLPAEGGSEGSAGDDGCPACGAEIGAEVPECPECGLALGIGE